MKNAIETKHKLDFEARPWKGGLVDGVVQYRIGTCTGLYEYNDEGISIIVIDNDKPGNGHLDDVFEWFEYAAREKKKRLWIRQFFNSLFQDHCIKKRGFTQSDKNPHDVYKDLTPTP